MKNYALILFYIFSSAFAQKVDMQNATTSFKGLFDFYYFEETDKIYLNVDKLDYEFLYVNALSQGLGSNDIGLDRGQLGSTQIVKFQKKGNKIILIQPNYDYRANTINKAEKKSVYQAFAKSVLFGFPIVQKTNTGYLIDITNFIMQDAHGVVNRLKRRKQGNFSLDKSRSVLDIENTKSFPKNIEFESLLTFKGAATGGFLRSVAPNSNSISVHQHHSFIELPDDNYTPRMYDPRSGAINIEFMDYATPVNQSIKKRYIIRHRLQKKHPNQEISQPIEPIVYYLDPGTPEPVKSALLDGARWWDDAFEYAGFKNAFQVKMLPENVDPLDIRYNVIQWVHRSTRGWSYGASIVDPRTGEIIKGHVSLGSLRIRQDYLIAQGLSNEPFKNSDSNDIQMMNLALARIRQLSAHEVGHTIGFRHNFAASTANRASVMDYPHPQVNITANSINFDNAYAVGIGEWDKITVAYSYSEFANTKNEKEELEKILSSAKEKGIPYISDVHARPAGGSHPKAHLWDNGNKIEEELINVLQVRKKAIEQFSIHNIKSDQTISELEDVFVPVYFFHRYQTEAASKLIGGVDFDYGVKSDFKNPLPVDAKLQRKTLDILLQTLGYQTLAIPIKQRKLFSVRAPGYYKTRESFNGKLSDVFDPYSAANTAANFTLKFLLHPQRASRLVIQKAEDANQLGLDEVIKTLLNHIKSNTAKSGFEKEIQKGINIQILKSIASLAISKDVLPQVNEICMSNLGSWKYSFGKKQKDFNTEFFWLREFMKNPKSVEEISVEKIPDGSPIGSFQNSCMGQ